MRMKARLDGKPLWMPNMVAAGVGGVLSTPQGRMGWASGSILEGAGASFRVILYLTKETARRSDSRTMCSAARLVSRWLFLSFTTLPMWRMRLWLLIWIFWVAPFSGILVFIGWFMIGKWIRWRPSILCSIPFDQEEKGRTNFGGTCLARGFSMLDPFTRLSLIVFFVWSASLGKILTLDNLRRRQVIMVNRCCLCKLEGEFVDHLLLHSKVARTFWVVLGFPWLCLIVWWI